MKTVYSCGCSFMSSNSDDVGFVDLYAEQKGFKHVNLARSGATNFLIRLQIEEAIAQNADYLVIGATSSERIDFPIPSKEHLLKFPVTIHDVDYHGYHSSGEEYVHGDPKIISDSINNWTTEFYHIVPHNNFLRKEVPQESIEAMKHYLAYLHNQHLAQAKDYYIIAEGLRKLLELGKQFVFISGPLAFQDWIFIDRRSWTKSPQPWDMPYGLDKSVNHNPLQAHQDFLQNLLSMTEHWK